MNEWIHKGTYIKRSFAIFLKRKMKQYSHFIFLLTVSVPHDLRLVFFHSGINNDSAAKTHCLAFTAKSHFKFLNDGGSKGDTVLSAETVYKKRKKLQKQPFHLH